MKWSKPNLATLFRGGSVLISLAMVLVLSPAVFAEDGKEEGNPDKEGEAAEGDGEKKEGGGSGVSAFGKFLPVGRPNEGVTIPSFENGVRTSLVKAAQMMRIDEDNLQLDDMEIQMYSPEGVPNSKITLLRAYYHMPTSVLTSRSRSKVVRPDFEIEGDGLVFDTETQRGRMAGNIEMIIPDVKAFGAQQGISAETDPKAIEKSGVTGAGDAVEGEN